MLLLRLPGVDLESTFGDEGIRPSLPKPAMSAAPPAWGNIVNELRRSARLVAAAGAVGLLLISPAMPAWASAVLGPDSVSTSGQSGNHLYSATLTVDVGPTSPLSPSTVIFVVNCQATATPDAAATSITECGGAAPTTDPGDFAVTAGGLTGPANGTAQLCVAGFATYLETQTGGFEVSGPRQCVTVNLTPLATTTVQIVGA